MKNVMGNVYRFFYDVQARLDSLSFPGGWKKSYYDADGRATELKEVLFNPTREWHHQAFTYDQRGRIKNVSVAGTPANWWTAANAYSGLGSVALSSGTDASGYWFEDQYRQDALQSASWNKTRTAPPPLEGYSPVFQYDYEYSDNRVTQIRAIDSLWTAPDGSWWFGDFTNNYYDAAGNVDRSLWMQMTSNDVDQGQCNVSSSTLWHRRATVSYYSADNKLRAQQVNRDEIDCWYQFRNRNGVWEEYWYDALGRRIFKRAYADSLICDPAQSIYCIPGQDRFVWDGDRLLYESHEGSVLGYTHAGDLDTPLDMLGAAPSAIVLHTNWRGLFDSGSDTTGATFSCAGGYWSGCTEIAWAGADQRAFLRRDGVPSDWWGSIITGQRDQTGQIYMRNRYYDPNTGQFTQEDPIGLAGGLNLYGFANGDPINFSDPFGLCTDPTKPECKGLAEQASDAFMAFMARVASGVLNFPRALSHAVRDALPGLARDAAIDIALGTLPGVGELVGGRRVVAVANRVRRFLTEGRHLRELYEARKDFSRIGATTDEVVEAIARSSGWESLAEGAIAGGRVEVGTGMVQYILKSRATGETVLNAWIPK